MQNIDFFEESKISFWAWHAGESSIFMFLSSKSKKSKKNQRCEFLRDVPREMHVFAKTTMKKVRKMMKKVAPNGLENPSNFR